LGDSLVATKRQKIAVLIIPVEKVGKIRENFVFQGAHKIEGQGLTQARVE